MKKLKLFSAMLMSAVAATATAEEYKAPLMYDLSGPVKEIKVTSGNKLVKKFGDCKFTENGQRKDDFMSYDGNGYPIGYNLSLGDKTLSLNIEYNADLLPETFMFHNTMGNDWHITLTNTYADGHVVTQTIVENGTTYQRVYSQVQRDQYGNWIARTVHQTTIAPDTAPLEETMVETQEITYY